VTNGRLLFKGVIFAAIAVLAAALLFAFRDNTLSSELTNDSNANDEIGQRFQHLEQQVAALTLPPEPTERNGEESAYEANASDSMEGVLQELSALKQQLAKINEAMSDQSNRGQDSGNLPIGLPEASSPTLPKHGESGGLEPG
jgi:hypothetical protein